MWHPQSREEVLLYDIAGELVNARAKFPGANATLAALTEEVGELAKAMLSEDTAAVRKEAIQVAVMAMRCVLDGDDLSVADYRADRGLAPLGEREG